MSVRLNGVSVEHDGSGASGLALAAHPSDVSSRQDFRSVLHSSNLAVVENTSMSGRLPPPWGYEPAYQIGLTYAGLFVYSVGRRQWLIDANKALFISPGWEFEEAHPVSGLGHAAILINPARDVIEELCGLPGPNKNSAFLAGSVQSSFRLRLLTQWMLSHGPENGETLPNDEWVVRALELAMHGRPVRSRPCTRTVERAKEFLHAHGCERMSLEEIARSVGVSPIYLTQEFTRSEGMPLYRYQLALRLGRALLELPHTENITALALDLGFSSHSHFTYVFRKAFGLTPSKYRDTGRSPGQFASAARIFDKVSTRRIRRAA
jgi:AraC family transcriptional regulator